MDSAAGSFEAAVGVLAELTAPAAVSPRPALSIPLEWFRWIPPCDSLFAVVPSALPASPTDLVNRFVDGQAERPTVAIDRGFAERLSGVQQVRASEQALRVGWLFVAGSIVENGRTRRVFQPLVTVRVRVVRPPIGGGAYLTAVGDVRVSSLVPREQRQRLEAAVEVGGGAFAGTHGVAVSPQLLARMPRLRRFAVDASEAVGLPADQLVPVRGSPDELMARRGLVIVAGFGVYLAADVHDVTAASTLREWAQAGDRARTAFHAVYGLAPATTADVPAGPVDGPLVLSPSQREAVRRSRTEPLTVVSGPPGTGKSHLIAAIACDAVARGERVLVAARSSATVDALVELLDRTPGPDPVVFGSTERRARLAARLGGGQAAPAAEEEVRRAAAARDEALAARDAARSAAVDGLRAELAWQHSRAAHDDAWSVAPGLLEPDVELSAVHRLLEQSNDTEAGWWRRRRRNRAWSDLVHLARADPSVSRDALARVVATAEARAEARVLDTTGGLDLRAVWERLEPLDEAARVAVGTWLAVEARSAQRINPRTLRAIGALATALRSGRAARREQLARLDGAALTTALPLWIGTLADIDDLLPSQAASFDLVLLDEASSIDQPSAAPALLRARRAVVVGDPRQLRHVSFLSDEAIRTSVARHGLTGTPLAAQLDVRRNSAFDAAAAAAPVTTLSEHYRSDPHLVDFVTRRLYDGAVVIATRSPLTDRRDCVDAVRVAGESGPGGAVRAEIDEVLRTLRLASSRGARSVGVVTPFRAQADALEKAVLATFGATELERMDLRIGTVHGFQGIERDLVLCSLGIVDTSDRAMWRFAQDPHLLTVFLTRARHQLVFVYSTDPPPDGLLAAYLAGSDSPPGPATSDDVPGPWSRRVADHLAAAGFRLAVEYPTGRHVIDAVLLDAPTPTALVAGVHPDGPDAHIDRHLALRRRGWQIEETFESRWADQLALLAVRLRDRATA